MFLVRLAVAVTFDEQLQTSLVSFVEALTTYLVQLQVELRMQTLTGVFDDPP